MTNRLALAAALALALAACKKKEEARPAAATPTPAAAPAAPTAPEAAAPSGKRAPPPSSAPVDPAAFVPVDVSGIAALAGVTVKGPPGATVTADEPGYNQDKPTGATIASGDFVLHLWHSTVGGERTALPITAEMQNGTYVETTSTPELVEYTIEIAGAKTYGFLRPIAGFTEMGDQLLCGPAKPQATAEALAPYRAACDTVGKK